MESTNTKLLRVHGQIKALHFNKVPSPLPSLRHRPYLTLVANQRRHPCSGTPTDLTNYRKCVSLIPDWQIDNSFFNRPIMVCAQILVHRWVPITRILALIQRRK